MRKFIIGYSEPAAYKGTYLMEAEDGVEASNKVQRYLEETKGKENNTRSITMEVYGNEIMVLGEEKPF